MMMLPEHVVAHWIRTGTVSDTGQTDGTRYFPDSDGLILEGRRRVNMYVTDTPGAAGTNTYTIEAQFLAGGGWNDVTSVWAGVANFTTTKNVDQSHVPHCVYSVRLKRVRAGDAANNDGGTVFDYQLDR